MAAALASGAALTLIDEPVAGLDKASVVYLTEALDRLAGDPARVVIVAHYEVLPGVRWRNMVQLAA
jgi:ABC-type Mn2+/Zn2+ transport system ATPase subunit